MPRSLAILLWMLLALVTTGATLAAGQQSKVSVSNGAINDLDRATQQSLQAPRVQQNIVLRFIGRSFNWWGGPGVVWFAAFCWLGGRMWKRAVVSEMGLRGLEAIAVASALSGIIKGLAGRSRPFLTPGEPWHWSFAHGWTDAKYFSMPSGHTTATFAFAAAVTIVAVRVPRYRAAIAVVAFVSAGLVGFARVFTNQHWLSDVVVGALLGSITGIVLTRWHTRHPHSSFDRRLLGVPAEQRA
jgi:membrane-associated phospholipid phosphatase